VEKKWTTRDYRPGDERGIVDLWKQVFSEGGEIERADPAYWNWQFRDNPAGLPKIRVAVADGSIVGHYAVIPVHMEFLGKPVLGTLSLDTMTHPDYRRQGMLTTLANELYADLGRSGFPITYGFPNDNSFDALIDKLQWTYLCSLPVYVKPLRPGAIVDRVISNRVLAAAARPLAEVGAALVSRPITLMDSARSKIRWLAGFDERVDDLWRAAYDRKKIALSRGAAFLNWRYFLNPKRGYRAVAFEEEGRLVSFAVVRCMEQFGLRGGMITDWVGQTGRDDAMRAVLAASMEYFASEGMDLAAFLIHGDRRVARLLRRSGFLPAPKRSFKEWYFTVRVNNADVDPSTVNAPGNWYVTFGDTDVI
jgi:hypothetical protein